jgi:hypothetical protein
MATTFSFSLRPIISRPLAAAGFGAFGGPIAFLAGERLGAVTLHRPLTPGLILLAVSWAGAMLIFWAVERWGDAARHGQVVGHDPSLMDSPRTRRRH